MNLTPPGSVSSVPAPTLSNRMGLWVMKRLASWPLSWVRALGWVCGWLLYLLAVRRRRIASINWGICFPEHSPAQRRQGVRQHFIAFFQAWLDRSWLWEGDQATVRQRLRLVGAVDALHDGTPTVLFAPHFVGMDAGWIALTALVDRKFCGIYARQQNADIDRWMAQGRRRFGDPHIVAKNAGLKPLVSALRAGEPLYLLPDMDYGPRDSVFVPFFGRKAATIPSLSRFARMARGRVVAVVSRMTPEGYEVTVHEAWADFPSEDAVADTAEMNRRLEQMIRDMPHQYYWVHKRFKTRPAGEASPYAAL